MCLLCLLVVLVVVLVLIVVIVVMVILDGCDRGRSQMVVTHGCPCVVLAGCCA